MVSANNIIATVNLMLAKLMTNEEILRHMPKHYADVLSGFDCILRMATLDK